MVYFHTIISVWIIRHAFAKPSILQKNKIQNVETGGVDTLSYLNHMYICKVSVPYYETSVYSKIECRRTCDRRTCGRRFHSLKNTQEFFSLSLNYERPSFGENFKQQSGMYMYMYVDVIRAYAGLVWSPAQTCVLQCHGYVSVRQYIGKLEFQSIK